MAPECAWIDVEVRQLVYGNYRLLFRIDVDTVNIIHVRHAARRYMTNEELTPPNTS